MPQDAADIFDYYMNVVHSFAEERMITMPNKIDFIGGNTKRCLMAMALPMIAAMFLNMMYNLVDSLWIGNLLGETAYAALTNSTPIILILTSVAMGATNGVSILISQAIGAKDKKKTESLIATSFSVAVAFSLLVTILLEAFLPGFSSGNFESSEHSG